MAINTGELPPPAGAGHRCGKCNIPYARRTPPDVDNALSGTAGGD